MFETRAQEKCVANLKEKFDRANTLRTITMQKNKILHNEIPYIFSQFIVIFYSADHLTFKGAMFFTLET